MNTEMNNLIHKINIPNQMKIYFKECKKEKEYINKAVLIDIEELYIFYKSLYYFDESRFSAIVISTLNRSSDHPMYYYYLKKVLDNKLELISKDLNFSKRKNEILVQNEIGSQFHK